MCIGRDFMLVEDNFRKHKGIEIQLPKRATYRSSGYDFYLPIDILINPSERKLIWTDIKAYMEDDEELLIFPRSGLGVKGLIISNTIGKIDCDYFGNINNDGNIGICLWNTSDKIIELKCGDRFCQGSFYKYLITKSDDPIKKERLGGFGHSSGTKL